jgi:hypothetical protein
MVEREFLTLPVWDQFDAMTAETVARSVERCLPEPWAFKSVALHESGGQKRQVAFFDWDGSSFALIPGGEVTLGYDPAKPSGVSAELVIEWEEQAREYEGWENITWSSYLARVLSPLRTVSLGPFLIATQGKRKPESSTAESFRKRLSGPGLRLPTDDQWAYACSAGTRTLWYWGDAPSGRTPQNAFGLTIANNTYHQESLDTPGEYRGGDGGVREHGGALTLERMVTLSSWFWSRAEPEQEEWWEYTRYRLVLPLPDTMLG